LGFVEQENSNQSHFLRYVDSPNVEAEIAQAITTFSPFESVEAFKTKMSEFWDFSSWLSQNKNSLDYLAINGNIPENISDMDTIITIWDNVYYSILTRSNQELRQACLQVLVALNFVKNHKQYLIPRIDAIKDYETETLNLRRLANGKVLINKVLTPKKNNSSVSPTPHRKSSTKQESQLEAKKASQNIPTLEKIRNELPCFEKQYNSDYTTALNTAKIVYEKQVETIIEAYLRQNPELEIKGDTEYLLPENLVLQFQFSYQAPFSTDYTKGKLSVEAIAYIQNNCLSNDSIKNALEHITNAIRSTGTAASRATKKRYNTVLINGVLTRPNSSEPKEFTLSFRKQAPIQGSTEDTYSALLLVDIGYNGGFLASSDFRLTIDGKTFGEKEAKLITNNDNSVFMELFSETPIAISSGKPFSFDGQFTLDNGKSYVVAKKGHTSSPALNGSATPLMPSGEPVVVCGVSRLGIADFRRVEQELCCYVPGEVSHIENILAKEYKERSTRNLTTTETTTESTTEREVEDLTDTTSSTRHEMSSEVAEVIEKDRQSNFGFSAGTGGSYGKAFTFSANASGDFSFGQSTSDSNTQAKTYAEDVTRRALERIVQKTSSKRTSRILREFEENNKHGYDNREGDKHVTGVFRWVDKVYKNRIVNYGKRLVYEFMVPEPARFYKQAIIVQAEEEDTTTGNGTTGSTTVAVKPTAPSEYGVRDANSITRENYTNLASMYGISIDVPMNEFSNVQESYAQSIGNTDDSKSFSFNTLRVTDNYQCYELNGTVSYNYKAKVGAKAYIKVNAAGKNWEHIELRGEGNLNESFTHAMSNTEGNISVGINTKKIVSFTVSVNAKCKLKSSIFEQWQQDAYADITHAYEAQLQAFNDAQAVGDANTSTTDGKDESGVLTGNPLYNAEIVKTDLKRLCIELMMKPFGLVQGKDFYQDGECDVPQLKPCDGLDAYASLVKFFEQAFDWDLMSQKFYPYYWAKRCDWKSLFQAQDGNDYIFQLFLQSGMGRVVVPVREGFEDAVTYFMETGEVWNGVGMAVDSGDGLSISVVDEMTQVLGTVEGAEWETTVPSALTIVQARSAYLDEEGLPCCHDDDEVLEDLNTIKPDENILKWKEQTPPAG